MHLGCKNMVGGAVRRGVYTEAFVPANYTGPVTFAGYYAWETPLQVASGSSFTCQDPYTAGPAAQMLYRPFEHFVETEGMFRIGSALHGNHSNGTLFFSPDAIAIVDPTSLAVATNGLSISVITISSGSNVIASKLALGNKNTGYVSGAYHGNRAYNVVTYYDVYYKITATMLYASLVEKDAVKPGTWELSLARDPMQIAHHGIIATCLSSNNIYGPAVVNVTRHIMA
ncbi:MAG: hypothetical protein Q8O35_06800 [Humidesulfovibrio sp.]|uniref:hypothetical protein n=1 Tax=Humidesulfovibrio sp. TaxID=2910988 RepID=UPI0027326FB1|nr:hypothetical protein [Humidesulfovibrio sp.]MDP2847887.1 hypothetical protein [Humidesulfovibrio sp.]